MGMQIRKVTAVLLAGAIMLVGVVRGNNSVKAATGEYKTWLQTDARWGGIQLGSSGSTMSRIGCATTAMAMLVVHSGSATEATFDPGKLCTYMSGHGGYDASGNIYWNKVSGLVPGFKFMQYTSFKTTTEADKAAELSNYIANGYYMAVSVRNQGHWVAVNYVSGSTVYIMDPASNAKTNLFASYDCAGVTQIRLFKGVNAPPTGDIPVEKPPVTPPVATTYKTGHYLVRTALHFRENPGTSYAILDTMPAGTTISVVGINGAWGKTTYKDKTGWVCLDYADYAESGYAYPLGNYCVMSDNGLYVRAGVGSTNKALGLLWYQSVVNVTAVQDGWGKIKYNNADGWICLEYARFMDGFTTPPTTTTTTKPITTTTTTKATTTTTTKPTTTTTTTTTTPATTTTTSTTTTTTTTTTTSTTTTTAASDIPGDLDGNGKIGVADLIMLSEFLGGNRELTPEQQLLADLNNDGVVDTLDLLMMQCSIMGLQKGI